MTDCPWIVMRSGNAPEDAMTLECRRCGDIQRVTPSPFYTDMRLGERYDIIQTLADRYHDMHKDCKRRSLDRPKGN